MKRFDTTRTTGRWPSILSALGVDEKTLSRRNCACPWCGGKDRFRFTDQDGAGVWVCNSCGSGNGYHFVMKWEGVDFKGACAVIERLLPDSKVTTKPHVSGRDRLRKVWRQSRPVEKGDPVDLYLSRRNVLYVPHSYPKDIRTHMELPYYDKGKHTGSHPAMIALIRDWQGNPCSLHVTYLTERGRKAKVESVKKILAPLGPGAHVALYPLGEGRKLLLCEGIETTMAAHKRSKGLPAYAMLSTAGLMNFKPAFEPGEVAIRILGDNDKNFAGQAAAYAIAFKLASHGHEDVMVMLPEGAKDYADLYAPQANATMESEEA